MTRRWQRKGYTCKRPRIDSAFTLCSWAASDVVESCALTSEPEPGVYRAFPDELSLPVHVYSAAWGEPCKQTVTWVSGYKQSLRQAWPLPLGL